MSEPQAGPERPQRLRPYRWLAAPWSDRLLQALVFGVLGGVFWRFWNPLR